MLPAPAATVHLQPSSGHDAHMPWRLIWLALMLVVLHLSLFPFTGWQLRHPSVFSFLLAPRQHWVPSDFVANVAAYVGLGFVWMRAWFATAPREHRAVALVTLVCTLISCTVETLQSFLPGRVPTYFDVLANGGGALLGAIGAVAWVRYRDRSAVRIGATGPARDLAALQTVGRTAGWALLLLWLLAQVLPHRLVLGAGELPPPLVQTFHEAMRAPFANAFGPPTPSAWRSVADVLAVGTALTMLRLLLQETVRSPRWRWPLLLLMAAAALLLRVAAAWPLWLDHPFAVWVTPAVLAGLVLGLMLTLLIERLSVPLRMGVLVLLALVHFVVINTTPVDAYFLNAVHQMYGLLTRYVTPSLRQLLLLTGILWPPLVAIYGLTLIAGRQRVAAALPASLPGSLPSTPPVQ